MADFLLPFERLADETMNVGISYNPLPGTILSIDVRNLTEEKKENSREFHFGFEQNIFSLAAIRGGYFKERFNNSNYYSFGIGLIDSNLLFKKFNRFFHHDFIINYAFIYQEKKYEFSRCHFFSLLFRI